MIGLFKARIYLMCGPSQSKGPKNVVQSSMVYPQLVNLLTLLQQFLDLEVFSIALGEHANQLALTSTGLTTKVIEALNAANQPGSVRGRNSTVRVNLAVHKNQTLLIGQIQVVCNSCMRLSIGTVHFEGTQVGKNHSRSVCVGRFTRGRNEVVSRWMESPLQEVDFGSVLSLLAVGRGIFNGLLDRDWKNELRVVASGGSNALVCFKWDNGADRGRTFRMTEAPKGLDLLWRKITELFNV